MKKITTCVILLALLATLAFSVSASAAQPYTAIGVTTNPQFTKYLTLDKDANIPAATFSFTVAAGTAVDAGTNTLAVLAGPIVSGKPSIANVVFAAAETTSTDQPITNGTATDGIVNSTDKKYATKTATIDFTGVTFDEPGVYRYIITESAQTDTTGRIVNDTTTTRTLDVYIKDNNGTLAFDGYVLYNGTVTGGPSTSDNAASSGVSGATKNDKYVNEVVTKDLTLSKTVTGNQGSRDKFFKFTIAFTDLGNGTVVNVEKTGAAVTPTKSSATVYEANVMGGTDANGVTKLTANASGAVSHDFYLSDGDTVKITGIPKGAKYTVTEVPEDYAPTATINSTAAALTNGATAQQTLNDDSSVAFTNTRTGTVPTGVMLTMIPGVLIVAAGAAGLFLIQRKKRGRQMKKAASIFLAVLLIAGCGATAFAENTYTPVTGTNTTFDKYLTFDSSGNVPSLTFDFTIVPGTGIAAANGKMEVLAGVGTPSIAAGQAAFSSADAKNTTVLDNDGVTLQTGKAYAKKTVTIDFSTVSFDEPGIYRYLLTETSSGQTGVTYDTGVGTVTGITPKQRVLDVYVVDNEGSLAVSQYVIHEKLGDVAAGANMGSGDAASAGAALSDKSKGFVNDYQTYDLTISKAVSGNQASKDKYFQFTVAIENAGANAALNIDMTNAATSPTKRSATQYTAEQMAAANGADDSTAMTGQQWVTNASGNVTKTIYLQHGQSVTISGLAAGAKYTVTENPEDYQSSAPGNKIENQTGMTADETAAFTNIREGTVPTGVMLTVIPGVLLVAAAAAGLIAIRNKKREK